ncbi:hypothetical protein [Rhizobium sp. Leaf341]|uniref:hypothetical protein n=1 Tax=Rhizobium sp. Leaf341 TaxID=1736344 RepID=UPI000714DE6E|nr:hypothetical protein [Rhizobium sp. Leaf341]KQR67882.1 hypothetical protein ASG03_10200 [Rhizobium sp. Leaf341]
MAKTALMKERRVTPGYLGLSRGDRTVNAIIYGADLCFYFYPITPEQARLVEDWAIDGDEQDLRKALPEATEYDLDMFYAGKEIVE